MSQEKYFEIWKSKLEEKEKYIEQLRAIKHDTQAHLIVLQYYLESGMYDEAKMYLKELRESQEISSRGIGVDTGDVLIDVLVEEYINRDKEIKFWCSGKISENVELSTFDLCVMFSNLMSNAVEACEKLTSFPKEIYMKMNVSANKFEIRVENYIDWDIDINLLGKGTTKSDKDNHGYGIKNLKSVVEKYSGNIKFEIEENKFCVGIELPLIEDYNKRVN